MKMVMITTIAQYLAIACSIQQESIPQKLGVKTGDERLLIMFCKC
jgi:hypothetical protein